MVLLLDCRILDVPPDSVEESVRNLVFGLEFLKGAQLLLHFLVFAVKALNHLGHITDRVGVEAHTEDHPTTSDELL